MLRNSYFPIQITKANSAQFTVQFFILFLGLVIFPGCQTSKMVQQAFHKDAGIVKPAYDNLVLNYETQNLKRLFSRMKSGTGSLGLMSRVSHNLDTEKSKLLADASPSGKWSQARIQIIYPHPQGSTEKGLAKLVVSRHSVLHSSLNKEKTKFSDRISKLMLHISGTSPELSKQLNAQQGLSKSVEQEIWQLDLPKEELDILLSELSQRGFFKKQERPRGEATVSISVNREEISKRWTSEPRLEDLMQQVYDEGELTAFNTQRPNVQSVSVLQNK